MKKLFTITLLMMLAVMNGYSQIVINEFLAKNETILADENGDYDDWIELFNTSNETVDIGGYYITDDRSEPMQYQFPEGDALTQIQPGGFLLLWADKETDQGVLHVGIKLSVDGEEIFLYEPDGETIADSVVFGAQSEDVSYGRQVDAGENWVSFNDPTPQASNETSSVFSLAEINAIKVYPNPVHSVFCISNLPDQGTIEIYDITGKVILKKQVKTASNQINLSGLKSSLYLYKITSSEGFLIREGKIIKQ